MRYNFMCTPWCHLGKVIDLVLRQGNTNNKPLMCLERETCMPFHWMTKNWTGVTVRDKWEEDGGLGSRSQERRKTPF